MSEHLWTQENLAAYVADGLDATQRERLERHVAECATCAGDLEAAHALDRKLALLFPRPDPALEDRTIEQLRTARPRLRFTRAMQIMSAAAAVTLLAIGGAGIQELLEQTPQVAPEQLVAGVSALAVPSAKQGYGGFVGGGGGPAIAMDSYARDDNGASMMSADALGEQLRRENIADLDSDVKQQGLGWARRDSEAKRPEAESAPRASGGAGGGADNMARDQPSRPSTPALLGLSDLSAPAGAPKGGGEKAGTIAFGIPSQKGAAAGEAWFRPLQELNAPAAKDTRLGRSAKLSDAREDKREPALEQLAERLDVAQREERQAVSPAEPAAAGRKIIRTGEIEFVVDSFDDAVAIVQKLVAGIKGGFIATINSDKLANGKVKGSIVVRVPPEQLDALVMGLRKEIGKAGELKGQRIGSQDVTKQYTDLESRLKAARTMEERLLKIIQEGKGVIKDLLQAEKELGVWRTRIEEMEGELRYYANQVSLSTLTINVTEKEIRLAAAVTETERVQAGIEVEDVDKAYRAALAAITEAKGRVTRSELKQHSAGQFSALLHFEVAHDAAGPLRDRLRQLGTMVRLEIDRVQHAEGGGKLPMEGKLERGPTQFQVSLYNLANVAPRETVVQRIAAVDVPQAYRTLREAVVKAQGRVVNANLNEQDRQNVTAQIDFDLRRADEALPQATLTEIGETLSRQVSRVPEGDNVTDAKVLYRVEVVSAANIEPRESVLLGVEVANVENALSVLTAQVKEAQGRVVRATESLERNGQVTARVIVDVPLAASASLVEKVRSSGHVRAHQLTQNQQAPAGKLAIARLDVTLSNADLLVPRDEGLWQHLRHGLSVSLRGLAVSAGWLIIGVLFVLPWLLLILAAVWLVRRLWRAKAPSANV